jgi:hypothetical protein
MKAWKVVLIVGVIATLAVGAGVAFAQGDNPPPGERLKPRWFSDSNERPRSMNPRGGEPLLEGEPFELHTLMLTTLANELDLSPEELEAQLEAEGGMMAVLLAQGYSFEDARELLLEVHSEAIQEAVEQGLIDEDQADWLLERMQGFGVGDGGKRPQGFRPYDRHGGSPGCQNGS